MTLTETVQTKRPLIFVSHSLGGLVCAEVMVMGARRASGDSASVIAQHTRGMIFFGTPFCGSKGAQPAEIARKILSALGLATQSKTLKLLDVDSERLKELNIAFQETMRKRITSDKPEDKIGAMFFYETLPTDGKMVSHLTMVGAMAELEPRSLSPTPQKFQVAAIAVPLVRIISTCVSSRQQMTRITILLLTRYGSLLHSLRKSSQQ